MSEKLIFREFKLQPIGVVHSPFKKNEDIPRERCASGDGFADIEGEIEIFKEYEAGLKDTEGFSHLVVIFVFHLSQSYKLLTKPILDTRLRGIFSTRSPHRPNPIGMTVVKVISRKGNILRIGGVDMIEGTPILDIKPYTSRDVKKTIKLGWLESSGCMARIGAGFAPARQRRSIRSSLSSRKTERNPARSSLMRTSYRIIPRRKGQRGT